MNENSDLLILFCVRKKFLLYFLFYSSCVIRVRVKFISRQHFPLSFIHLPAIEHSPENRRKGCFLGNQEFQKLLSRINFRYYKEPSWSSRLNAETHATERKSIAQTHFQISFPPQLTALIRFRLCSYVILNKQLYSIKYKFNRILAIFSVQLIEIVCLALVRLCGVMNAHSFSVERV